MGELICKRVYESPEVSDGERVLVDRLWPRGVRKEAAQLDLWARQVAPSPELRRWFAHDPARFEEFSARYEDELSSSADAVGFVREVGAWLADGNVTLLYAAKDPACNHALILRRWLLRQLEE